jgi:hypothetical protein
MGMQVQIRMRAPALAARPPRPAPVGILQWECACGGSGSSGGECAARKKKKVQRRTSGDAEPAAVPPIVNEVLGSPGRPLDSSTEKVMASRFSLLRDQPLRSLARNATAAKLTVNTGGRHE